MREGRCAASSDRSTGGGREDRAVPGRRAGRHDDPGVEQVHQLLLPGARPLGGEERVRGARLEDGEHRHDQFRRARQAHGGRMCLRGGPEPRQLPRPGVGDLVQRAVGVPPFPVDQRGASPCSRTRRAKIPHRVSSRPADPARSSEQLVRAGDGHGPRRVVFRTAGTHRSTPGSSRPCLAVPAMPLDSLVQSVVMPWTGRIGSDAGRRGACRRTGAAERGLAAIDTGTVPSRHP